MTFHRQKYPKSVLIGLVCTSLSTLWWNYTPLTARFGLAPDDFLRGALSGLGLGLMLTGLIQMRRQRRCGRERETTETASAPQQ